jgi:hypothetical protein
MINFSPRKGLGLIAAAAIALAAHAVAGDPDSVRVVLNGSGPFQIELLNLPDSSGEFVIVDKKKEAIVQNLTLDDKKGYKTDKKVPNATPFGIARYANLPAGEYRFEFVPGTKMNAYFEVANVGRFKCTSNPNGIALDKDYNSLKVQDYQSDTKVVLDTVGTMNAKGRATITYSCKVNPPLLPNSIRVVLKGKTPLQFNFKDLQDAAKAVNYTYYDGSKATTEAIDTSDIDEYHRAKIPAGTYDFTFKPGEKAVLLLGFPDGNNHYLFAPGTEGVGYADPANAGRSRVVPAYSRCGTVPSVRPNMVTFNCD